MSATEGAGSLAEGLARAARWSGHLPEYEARAVLRGWLAERLGGRPADEIRHALGDLLAVFPPPAGGVPAPESLRSAEPAPEPEPPRPAEPTPAAEARPEVPLDRLFAFARRYYGGLWQPSGSPGADAQRAFDALEELESRLRAAVPRGSAPEATLRDDLAALEARLAATDGALKAAAKESLSRLLEALSPAAIEAQAGRKGVKLGPFHKAGLYEAWCEKFGQLRAYHDAGRLVADLRESFRNHLRAAGGEERKG